MAFVSVVLICLACISASYYVWNYCRQILDRFFVRKEINLPGPRKFLKHFLRFNDKGLLDVILGLARYYPSPFKMQLNNISCIVIYEPNQVKTVLQSQYCLEKTIFYKYIEAIFGKGLLTAPASIWTQNRKIIVSSFIPNRLQEFFNTFVGQSLILTNKLEKIGSNGNKIIFFEHVTKCVLDIVLETMGNKIDSNERNQCLQAIVRLKEILRYRMYSTCALNNLVLYNIIFNLTTLGREQQKILKSMNSLLKSTLQLDGSNNLYATHKSFIDNFLEIFRKKNFTKESIYDNILTLIITANDTISITLDFTVFMLANFPEIQENVYKELEKIYGMKTATSAPVKYDDLQHMHYLDRVIKETMRLFPVIPIISRKLTEDMKIGESIFSKHTDIMIVLIWMCRNEEYWPNSLKFDPDRFLPERIKDCPSHYYIPFSDGPRNCIGIKYAMISMKVILATLVRTFIFKVDKSIEINKIKLKMDLTLSPIEPLKINIEKRKL